MTPFLISPPFGSYLEYPTATSVLGSYTLHRRGGRKWKTLQFFWDNWMHPVDGGWVNRIGLRNPGLYSVQFPSHDLRLYSIVGLADGDWQAMYDLAHHRGNTHIRFELNLGCPNVHEYGIEYPILEEFCRHFWCGVKLPADPVKALKIAEMAASAGAKFLHAGNTFQTPRGGVSGKPLKPINLKIVEALARLYPNLHIVGGGGIYTYSDLLDYAHAGATVFSLATVCFRPKQARLIMKQYEIHYGKTVVSKPTKIGRQ